MISLVDLRGLRRCRPRKVDHALRQAYLAQSLIPFIFGAFVCFTFCSGAIDAPCIARFRSIEHDLVRYRLVGRSEGRVIDGKVRKLRWNYRIMVAFSHRIVGCRLEVVPDKQQR